MAEQCIYNKLNTDVSNYSYTQTSEQLDFCLGCDKYYSCNKVAELNDRLVELDNHVDDETQNEITEVYKIPLGTKVMLNTDGETVYTVVSIRKCVLTGTAEKYARYEYQYGLEDDNQFLNPQWFKRSQIRVIEEEKTYYLTLDVNMQVDVQIKATSLEQAIEKARNEQYELPNLNDGDNIETTMVRVSDENFNTLEEF